ncbi:DNA topoisomerase II [Nematocida sp. LUAm3]|nr:DNA topoisomerase II [Nematocida sp. LUAm3]KAI5173625.1 DNA topoisomerase II [Nematocida sp. LUAm2]KAI5176846.1 DNA topoisomerase II [Nematocida sp. LUAm1]
MSRKEKSVEETYQKKTPIEHVLIRPDTYIGSVQTETRQMHVWHEESKTIQKKDISYAPGLYKIFDEVLVNAADNKTRDPRMKCIKVSVDQKKGEITVYNDGKGIPIVMHTKENVYVPELIFGHLLTSSNYDDSEKKITGGRNGYGAKLCNIFSKQFIIETADAKRSKKFRQVYRNNMLEKEEPEIEPYDGTEYTQVSFIPDLKKFGMKHLDDDFVSLITKRVYDLAGTVKGIDVFFNDQEIEVKSFKDYINLYFEEPVEVAYEAKGRWEVAFVLGDEQFQQVSFANRICTPRGGTHVSHVADQIVNAVVAQAKKKEKGLIIKPIQVKANIYLFLNCLIENPAFDSQTKETLTLKSSSFGSTCSLSNKFITEVIQSGIVEKSAYAAKAKQNQQLKKTDGHKTSKIRGIPKLDDANNAGTRHAAKCTLILTEGDSAKALAVSGLSVIGRDNYGVFPLRGKLLNVREATHKQLMENAEINNIKKIMGLQHGKKYENTDSLRYGHVMIMTDQDHDGSHIKGLIINMLEHFFPSLLQIEGFLQEFITPIVRATKDKEIRNFFTIPEYETWIDTPEGRTGKWTVKYYKGLGTSTAKDARDYFSNLQFHQKIFNSLTDDDRERIELAFSKKRADARKFWLKAFIPGIYLDNRMQFIPIKDFIDKELIHFSLADNVRSIPNVIDGLKPGQRKVIFCCFKRKLHSEIKVAQLAGYVAEHSAYHHGEQSLCQTIVNLAQNFVGSNNIPLLQAIGQFGTRLQGGKDAASPRYIYTALHNLTRTIFPEEDDELLTYLKDDNILVEPEKYVPILPMLLINGAEGIGTGWSTSIPCYNPKEVAENILRMINGQEPKEMAPWYRGFTGEIEKVEDTKYRTSGAYEQEDNDTLAITELPIGTWTQNYKDYLETLMETQEIKTFKEYNTDTAVYFDISLGHKEKGDLTKKYKLATVISTANMVAFDSNGSLKKYNSPEEILKEFYAIRKDLYIRRKAHLLQKLFTEKTILDNRVRFIKEVVENTLVIVKRPAKDVVEEMERLEYHKKEESYDYLLSMSISSLTKERMEKLEAEAKKKHEEYLALQARTIEEIWISEIERFLNDLPNDTDDSPTSFKKRRTPSKRQKAPSPVDHQNERKPKKASTTKTPAKASPTKTPAKASPTMKMPAKMSPPLKKVEKASSATEKAPWSRYLNSTSDSE